MESKKQIDTIDLLEDFSISSPIGGMLTPFINHYKEYIEGNKKWKERILKEFRESINLPRKKKKAVRKRLNTEWSIACWADDVLNINI